MCVIESVYVFVCYGECVCLLWRVCVDGTGALFEHVPGEKKDREVCVCVCLVES